MAKRKDTPKDTEAANITVSAATPAPDKVMAKDAPLPVEAPAIASKPQASSDAPEIDMSLIKSLIGPVKPDAAAEAPVDPSADAESSAAAAAFVGASRWRLPATASLVAYAPLAAGIALAVAAGVIAGATTTLALLHDSSTAAAAATASVAGETRALQASVTQLNSELTAIKAGLGNAQRTTTVQMGKLTERLDRAERAQAEPAAKLARITETIDRLEKRQQQAAMPAPAVTAVATVANPDITGSTVAYKEESRPPVAEGWRLRDFYQGRAVVESRNGMLFEVGPGSNLPGLGKVETIKREDGRLVVVAKNGIITAMSEPRRPPGYVPYRY